jgi:hypothetical protein
LHSIASTPELAADLAHGIHLAVGVGDEAVDGDDRRTPNFFTFSIWRARLAAPFFSASMFSLPRSSLATPPCILSARMVPTMTAAAGFKPALRHLMSKNFSGAEVGAEAGFGHHVIGQLQRAWWSRSPSCSHGRCWRTGRHG